MEFFKRGQRQCDFVANDPRGSCLTNHNGSTASIGYKCGLPVDVIWTGTSERS